MNKTDELPIFSLEDLHTKHPSFPKAEKVLILDFVFTLFNYDEHGFRYLVGGEATKDLLSKFHQHKVALCIIMQSDQACAEEAVTCLKDAGIAEYFHFVAYDNSPSALEILLASKVVYGQKSPGPNTIQFSFVSSDNNSLVAATRLGITAFQVNNPEYSSQAQNVEALQLALSGVIAHLNIGEFPPADATNPERFNPLKPRSRPLLLWLLTSFYPSVLTTYLATQRSPTAPQIYSSVHKFIRYLKNLFLLTFPYDGLDLITNQTTCADGNTSKITPDLTWLMFIASIFGLPNRPDSIDPNTGAPILTPMGLLSNFFGGWTSLSKANEGDWTKKKSVQLWASPVKGFVIFPLKIVGILIKSPLTPIKLLSEFLLTLVSMLTAILTVLLGMLTFWLIGQFQKGTSLIITLPASIVLGAFTLALTVAQYATVLICRMSLATTSPKKSADFAFALGESLKIDWFDEDTEIVISKIMGVIGWLTSVALSTVLWAIILSAFVTLFPAILPAIAWVAQLPLIAATLAWVSQLALVTASLGVIKVAFATAVPVVSAAIGPIIGPVSTFLGIKVTALAAGVTVSLIAAPAIIIFNTVGDYFSYFYARWNGKGWPFSNAWATPPGQKTLHEDVPFVSEINPRRSATQPADHYQNAIQASESSEQNANGMGTQLEESGVPARGVFNLAESQSQQINNGVKLTDSYENNETNTIK